MSGVSAKTQPPPDGFVFDAPLTESAASVVFLVRDALGVCVCKRLGGRARADAAAVARLLREGRVVRALAGRGAPELVAAGADDAGPFVATRRLAMTPIAELAPEAISDALVRAAFRSLAEIHEATDAHGPLDVVHADVSPSNLLVAPDGAVARFVDFGLATMRDDAPPADGVFRGTLAFAAPEVARGEAFDARADLFALAASLLSIVSGEPPRSAPSDAALLALAGGEPIDAWARTAASRLEPRIAAALVACVAFDRDARPARARDVCGT